MNKFKAFDATKRILITGAAGFIGFHLAKRLLELGTDVGGFDNINDYQNVKLKEDRLGILRQFEKFIFVKDDLINEQAVNSVFAAYKPKIVINLAAQAGVRYSIENPRAYMNSNLLGFLNVLEACRHNKVEHLVNASSSSVYG